MDGIKQNYMDRQMFHNFFFTKLVNDLEQNTYFKQQLSQNTM